MPAVQTAKITLCVEPFLKSKAREAARTRGISVSALFGRFVSALSEDASPALFRAAPMTARAMRLSGGKVRLPKNWDYRDDLRDAITGRHSK